VCIEVGMSNNLDVVKVDLKTIMLSYIFNAIQCRPVF